MVGSAGGHFEEYELNDARACVIKELLEEINITDNMLDDIRLRYITLRRTKGEIRQNYYCIATDILQTDYKCELNNPTTIRSLWQL